MRRVGILAVAVLALAVGAIVLVATSGGSRSPAVDLRGVDWENASVPAAICGGEGAIRLHEGVALVSSRRWTDDWQGNATMEVPGQVEVWSYGDEVYGDIDGDGRDEAAVVPLWCTNGGGTGGGQLGQGLAIMSGVAGKVSSLGIARTTQDREDVHAPYFDSSTIRIVDHPLTVEELWHGPDDSTCCPSGRATSTWTYVDGTFRRNDAHVTATPTSRPWLPTGNCRSSSVVAHPASCVGVG